MFQPGVLNVDVCASRGFLLLTEGRYKLCHKQKQTLFHRIQNFQFKGNSCILRSICFSKSWFTWLGVSLPAGTTIPNLKEVFDLNDFKFGYGGTGPEPHLHFHLTVSLLVIQVYHSDRATVQKDLEALKEWLVAGMPNEFAESIYAEVISPSYRSQHMKGPLGFLEGSGNPTDQDLQRVVLGGQTSKDLYTMVAMLDYAVDENKFNNTVNEVGSQLAESCCGAEMGRGVLMGQVSKQASPQTQAQIEAMCPYLAHAKLMKRSRKVAGYSPILRRSVTYTRKDPNSTKKGFLFISYQHDLKELLKILSSIHEPLPLIPNGRWELGLRDALRKDLIVFEFNEAFNFKYIQALKKIIEGLEKLVDINLLRPNFLTKLQNYYHKLTNITIPATASLARSITGSDNANASGGRIEINISDLGFTSRQTHQFFFMPSPELLRRLVQNLPAEKVTWWKRLFT